MTKDWTPYRAELPLDPLEVPLGGQQDERAFHPAFLAASTSFELAALQHELRQHPEDRPYLDQVLRELSRRTKDDGL